MTGTSERTVGHDLGGRRHVGVWQDDHGVLRAPLALDALAGGRAARVDMARDGAGADETHGPDRGVIEDRESLLLTSPSELEARFGFEVRVRHQVEAIHRDRHVVTVRDLDLDVVFEQPYDSLVLATGAAPWARTSEA